MAYREQRVALEYRFRGYSPPEHLVDDHGVECAVTGARGTARSGGDLAQVREDLELDGFERTHVDHVETRNHWDPVWREIWAKRTEIDVEEGPPLRDPDGGLSPEAAKAVRESMGRARGYWPLLARTGDKAVVMRPRVGGRRSHRLFALGVAATLPQFRFNPKRNWWEAPLEELERAYEAFEPQVNLSEGAREYLGMEV